MISKLPDFEKLKPATPQKVAVVIPSLENQVELMINTTPQKDFVAVVLHSYARPPNSTLTPDAVLNQVVDYVHSHQGYENARVMNIGSWD